MHRKFYLVLTCMVLALGLSIGTGCKKGTPTTCKGWQKLLKSPVKGRTAIKELGELHCKESLVALEEIFPTSQYKDEILQSIRTINAPAESAGILKMAMADPDAAAQAAVVAEDFAIAELRQPVLDILTTDVSTKARLNALKALAKIDAANMAQHEDLLIRLVRSDPNIHGILVNATAARLLGELKSKKAIPDLIVGLFIRTQRGEQMYTAARLALARIGKDAVAPLVAALTGDRATAGTLIDDIESTAKRLGLFDWQWQEGPEIVQVLGDLRDTAAAEPIARNLAKPLNPPIGVDDRVLRTWQIAQQNRITMAMMALWNIGTPGVVPILKEIVINPDNDAKQRLDTASAMGLIEGYAGMDAILDVFAKTKSETFRAPMVKPIILGIDWDNLPAFQRMLKAEKSELVKARVSGDNFDAAEFRSLASVLETCKKNDVDCLIQILKGEDPLAATKAAILMGNLKGDDSGKALAALLEQYPSIDPKRLVDLRRFVLLSIWRLADKSSIDGVTRILQADNDTKGARYWVDEVEVLLAALKMK
jgi:HEAT repeat protein